MENCPPAQCYDIAIIGAGPAGLMLSTILARWGYRIKHIDNRPEPTKTGRADGIQPRSLDLFHNMGLESAIMVHNPALVYEVAFWNAADEGRGIVRTGTWPSCPSFIDARRPYTALLHQGYTERVLLSDMQSNGISVQRPWTISNFQLDHTKSDYPVLVHLEQVDGSAKETVRAKYLFSGEGSKSSIRQRLGIQLKHPDPIYYVWAVMDGVLTTDFPDIRMKCTIHSDHGSIMVIPRENNLVRLYIQIASSTDPDWSSRKTATPIQVQAKAKKIFEPYMVDWETVEWFSIYPISQGIADRYTLDCRVFLGGDACHTHSPKAGQGMNTAFLDAQNLAWKIHVVEKDFADRRLLETYQFERRDVAETLLAFDNRYAKLFSQKPPTSHHVEAARALTLNAMTTRDATDDFVETFKASCEFTSGYGVAYQPSVLTWSQNHPAQSVHVNPKGCRMRPGRLFGNTDVTRVSDANVVHLEQVVPLNGSFRLFIFAGKPDMSAGALREFERGLRRKGSFYDVYRRQDLDDTPKHEKHCPHSIFYSICIVFAGPRQSIDISRDVPGLLVDYRHHVYADVQPNRYGLYSQPLTHEKMGIDPEKGAVIVVRPDGYVGIVVDLVESSATVDALDLYFRSFCSKQIGV